MRPSLRILPPLLASIVHVPAPAVAHGFGQRYDLPIPLHLYVISAGAVIALSFVVILLCVRGESASPPFPVITAIRCDPTRKPVAWGALLLSGASAFLFVSAVVIGFVGPQSPYNNILPVAVWSIGWAGLTLLCAAVGNVWRIVNPWSALFAFVAWIFRRLARRRGPRALLRYPRTAGAWPAFVLYLTFAWIELVWSGKDAPARLAGAICIYSAITWTGMLLFGPVVWLARGEFFNLAFATIAKFAPWSLRSGFDAGLALRPPGAGLVSRVSDASMVAFVAALLATVTFDGLLETAAWAEIEFAVLNAPADAWVWTVLDLSEMAALRLARTIALIIFVLAFLAIFLMICSSMAVLTSHAGGGTMELARRFVLTLVPISVAYHVAHYFSFLAITLQYVVPILSDPLGLGWDLFDTRDFKVDIAIVGPRTQWYVAVFAVVIGHVISVYVAHVAAIRLYRDSHLALLSQSPVIGLMIGYTMLSLWILAQPIVETGVK